MDKHGQAGSKRQTQLKRCWMMENSAEWLTKPGLNCRVVGGVSSLATLYLTTKAVLELVPWAAGDPSEIEPSAWTSQFDLCKSCDADSPFCTGTFCTFCTLSHWKRHQVRHAASAMMPFSCRGAVWHLCSRSEL